MSAGAFDASDAENQVNKQQKKQRWTAFRAAAVPVSRFLVNTPAALGGIGYTTNLFPALTLGCGAVGGSSSSNNIGPMDLVNIRRVAWGKENRETEVSVNTDLVEALAQKILERLK